ncbi:hypothetical protein SAMN05428938_6026 [Streptomyces sp. KS_5]|nr:hypothetical protein SAMN05428938_6026 [Streptomyces sp. KS_5]
MGLLSSDGTVVSAYFGSIVARIIAYLFPQAVRGRIWPCDSSQWHLQAEGGDG